MGYREAVLADTPLLYWRLNDQAGSSLLADSSLRGNSGTPTGSPTLGAAGPLRGDPTTASVTFNGSTQYVSANHAAVMNVGDVLTLECWFKGAPTAGQRALIAKGGTGGYYLQVQTSKLTLTKSGTGDIVASTVNVDDNAWHYCVATKNGATVKLYVDSVDVTGAVSNQTVVDTTDAFTVAVRSPVANAEYIAGSIAEVALYGTALPASRVLAHYNVGLRANVVGTNRGRPAPFKPGMAR